MANEQVDGNDVIAVRAVAERAIDEARFGEGPRLIEALTYRLSDHTTADDASRYRDESEVESQRANDPINRFRTYLMKAGMWSDQDDQKLQQECKQKVEKAVEQYLATPKQPSQAMFDYLYAELPVSLQHQREAALVGEDHA